MHSRPQTSHPNTKSRAELGGRPQTQQVTKRTSNSKSARVLPAVNREKPKSAVPVKEAQFRIRLALPWTNQCDVSNKYWDIISRQTEAVWGNQIPGRPKRPMTATSANQLGWIRNNDEAFGSNFVLPTFEEKPPDQEQSRPGTTQPKSYGFLARLGGNIAQTNHLLKSEPDANKDIPGLPGFQGTLMMGLGLAKERKKTLTIFTDYNVDDLDRKSVV